MGEDEIIVLGQESDRCRGGFIGARRFGEIEELAALEAKLERAEAAPGNVVTVRLRTRVSDLGALELAAREEGSETPWRLAFDLRGGHEGARVSA